MVMPCSRSADRPSVSSARSVSPPRCTPASWSCSTVLLSTSRRPIRVLLPSSTLPQVMKRRAVPVSTSAPAVPSRSFKVVASISEIPIFLALLHRSFGSLVVHAGGTAFAHVGRQGLDHHVAGVGGQAFHRAGAGDVAHGAEAHVAYLDLFA